MASGGGVGWEGTFFIESEREERAERDKERERRDKRSVAM
jgi:hypothetical protein